MGKCSNIEALEYYDKRLKEYINMKINLAVNKETNCPNCGAQ